MGQVDFPSTPSHQPCTPEEDGFPNVRVTADSVILDYGEGGMRTLPFSGIERNGITIKPGGENGLNRIQVTLFASGISVDDAEGAYNGRIHVIEESIVREHA
jgi:hypothetical protein